MKTIYLFGAAALALGAPALAQNTLDNTSVSGSDANAVSGSASGAESNGNVQGQSQYGGNNAGIGSSTSESNSGAVAVTSSESGSVSLSDQGQSQGQTSSNSNELGQTATNSQGVQVATTFNTYDRKKTVQEFRTNAAVPLAASSSFSSDYCGGTASGGASVAPLGISIGGAAPTFDNSCRYLRVAEKAGMLGANYYNMRQPEMAGRAMSMMAWAVCMAGPQQDNRRKGYKDNVTMQACLALGLLGSDVTPAQPPQQEVTPMETQKPNVTPQPDQYKTPRGDLEFHSNPVIQGETYSPPIAAVVPR